MKVFSMSTPCKFQSFYLDDQLQPNLIKADSIQIITKAAAFCLVPQPPSSCPPSAPTNIDCVQFHFNRKISLSPRLGATLDLAEVHQLETQIYAVANIFLGGWKGTKQSIVSTAFEYHTTSALLKQKQGEKVHVEESKVKIGERGIPASDQYERKKPSQRIGK